jgi:hypothetical protein
LNKEIVVAPSESRRSFLFGRRESGDDVWLRFLMRLRRSCKGPVTLLPPKAARLTPGRLEDVFHARELCHEHSICLSLDGVAQAGNATRGHVLYVEAGSAWGSLIPLGTSGQWRVDAGCAMSAMKAAGLVHREVPESIKTMAQWLALWDSEDLAQSGLVSVEWMFADGTIEVLGPFGANDSQPLRSVTAQTCIPKLFELASDLQPESAQGLYRLDALRAPNVNLAHFTLGHRATLGWVIAATFVTKTAIDCSGQKFGEASTRVVTPSDRAVKYIMDPSDLFASFDG